MPRIRKQNEEIEEKPKEEKEEEKEVSSEETESKTCPKCGAGMSEGTCQSCGYKETKKDNFGGESPQEDTSSATDANSTLTSGSVLTAASPTIGAGPNTGNSLGSVEQNPVVVQLSASPAFRKSPVGQYIIKLEKELSELKGKTISKKDVEKMFSDWMAKNTPVRKALAENVGTETLVKEVSVPELEKRFRF